MEILKTIIYLLIIVIAALLIYAWTRPNTFRLQRSTVIKAPPEKVFGIIQDFKQWTGWSPWENIDAELKRTYSGAPSGIGTIYEWLGKKTGQGRMEITEADPGRKVSLKLDFIKPFKANNITDFELSPQDGGTRVNWVMRGPLNLMQRVMHIFFNMEKMVGPDFERGLANMKALAEK